MSLSLMSRWTLVHALFFVTSSIAIADVSDMPDYYDEPGVSSVRQSSDGLQGDSVDPASGQLTIQSVDLLVPGNGGLDIEVRRNYSLHNAVRAGDFVQNTFNGYGPLGVGWDIHFGRIWYDETLLPGCKSAFASTGRNPVLETPDGSKHILVNAQTYNNGEPNSDVSPSFISKNFWIGNCINQPYELNGETYNHGGMKVTSPDGISYTINYKGVVKSGVKDPSKPTDGFTDNLFLAYGVTEITDPRGNWIKIDYVGGGYLHAKRVYASDGREVVFEYENEATPEAKLVAITANGQTVQYEIGSFDGYLYDINRLDKVVRPDGGQWSFDYGDEGHERHLITRIKNPLAGETTYSYQKVQFESSVLFGSNAVKTRSVDTRIPSSLNGQWNYSFFPGNPHDRTVIEGPDRIERYTHFGVRGASFGDVWKIGSLQKKEIFHPWADIEDMTPLQQELYEWTSVPISSQNEYRSSRNVVDTETSVPLLAKKTIIRDGDSFVTEYSNYDSLGRVRLITETGESSGLAEITKTTTLGYLLDLDQWLILPSLESIDGVGQVYRNYRNDGLVEFESSYGVPQWYEYDTNGNLTRTHDIHDLGINYEDFYRGVPRKEMHEEGVAVTRTVNPTGTVSSETDGKGYTKNYEYDALNRITKITPTINASIDVSRTFYGKTQTLTRDDFTETRIYDGFGREVVKRILGEETIETSKRYDEAGRVIFESYPNSTEGVSYQYDALNRVVRIEEPGNKFTAYKFLSGNRVEETSALGNTKVLTFRSFGNPDQKSLVQISEEEGVITTIDRDKLDNIVKVSQGGVERSYTYNDKYFLVSELHPEVGTIDYEVDAVGNVTSSTVGGVATRYIYDDLYRLTTKKYPTRKYVNGEEVPLSTTSCLTPCTMDTQNVDDIFVYDLAGNMTHANRSRYGQRFRSTIGLPPSLSDFKEDVQWQYDFNENHRLVKETLNADGHQVSFSYGYNRKDALQTIAYPTGLVIDYAPDAYARATKVGNYASQISYHPSGQLAGWSSGGVDHSLNLNERLLPAGIQSKVGANEIIDLNYSYDLNNNIVGILDGVRSDHSRILGYDRLDRLTSASGIWGAASFSYDTLGNFTAKTVGGQNLQYHYDLQNRLESIDVDTVKRSFAYDGYGNVIDNGQDRFSYDDAGNLLGVVGAESAYYYDANNRRAVEFKQDTARVLAYSQSGKLLFEKNILESKSREYIYLGDALIARRDIESGIEWVAPQEHLLVVEEGAAGGSVPLQATAISVNGEDVSDSILWTSSLQGNLGTGGSITPNLQVGMHTLTLSVAHVSGALKLEQAFLVATESTAPRVNIVVSDSCSGPHLSTVAEFSQPNMRATVERLSTENSVYKWQVDEVYQPGSGECNSFSAGVRTSERSLQVEFWARPSLYSSTSIRLMANVNVAVEPRQTSNDTLSGSQTDDLIEGGDGRDVIHAHEGDDRIIGGTGFDTLYGGAGADTYVFNKGDAGDTIRDQADGNILEFGPGISPSDVLVSRNLKNLVIDFVYDEDTPDDLISVVDQFLRLSPDGSQRGYEYPIRDALISEVRFSDGTVWHWDIETIKQLVLLPTNGDDYLFGYFKEDNTLKGEGGSDRLLGADFDDLLFGGAGDDYHSSCRNSDGDRPRETCGDHEGLFGGNGNDVLHGGDGDDFLRGGYEHTDSVFRDELEELGYASFDPPDLEGPDADQLFGEAGADYLQGGAGDDLLDGGSDNDRLAGGSGSDTYQFSDGFGVDVIEQYGVFDYYKFDAITPIAADQDVIRFAGSISSADIRPSREAHDLILAHVNALDTVTVKRYFAVDDGENFSASDEAIDEVRFVDGVVWNHQDIVQLINASTSPSVELISPVMESYEFPPSTEVTFIAQALDPEGGDLSDSIYWYLQNIDVLEPLGEGRELNYLMPAEANVEQVIVLEVSMGEGIQSYAEYTIRTTDIDLAPELSITAPVDGTEISQGDSVQLMAEAIDGVDGDLSASVTWASDLDGSLGQGASLSALLSLGTHTITAGVVDSIDNTQYATVVVNVVAPQPLGDPASLSVTLNPVEPVLEGAVVTVNAAAAGATGTYEYRFKVKGAEGSPSAGQWIDLQGWSTSPQASWDTSGYFGKRNKVKVLSRIPGDPQSKIKEVIRGFEVSNPVTAVDLTVSPLGPLPQQSNITLSAEASGGSGEYEYKFLVKGSVDSPSAGAWVVLQDWSTASSHVWTESLGYVGDTNRVKVVARNRFYNDGKVKAVVKNIVITGDSI